ncbi:MAG: hypothetical protein AAF604_17800 [Acidobacteriota bacterium]
MSRQASRGLTTALLLAVALVVGLGVHQLIARPASLGGVGPDVTVIRLDSTRNYGAENGIRGYAVGTTSCNRGNAPLWWCDDPRSYCADEQHPVIAQNLYRLKDGRFEQIGMSWLKHGFESTNTPSAACGNCTDPPHGLDQLGIGCTDTYGPSLNGSRPMGKRSEVDARTGAFDFPITPTGSSTSFDQRLKVLESDVDPSLNTGALYWVEGHYIAEDDAAAGNGLNNASYRRVTVGSTSRNLNVTGSTFEGDPAIYAWKANDAEVRLVPVDVEVSGVTERFHVARQTTAVTGGVHYEYAVHNLNSDRSARRFAVTFPAAATISNVGFSGVVHHSGEPYATAAWTPDLSTPNQVSWSTDSFATDANANALRWGTMFSFWFDSTLPPTAGVEETLELFKPGSPTELTFRVFEPVFSNGFESGSTATWDDVCPPNC